MSAQHTFCHRYVFPGNFLGYRYLKLRASRYPSQTLFGPLPFTSPRAAMVSDTYTPKSLLTLDPQRKSPSLVQDVGNAGGGDAGGVDGELAGKAVVVEFYAGVAILISYYVGIPI